VCRFEHCSNKVCILLSGYQSDVPRNLGVGVVYYLGVVYLLYMLYLEMSCVYCC